MEELSHNPAAARAYLDPGPSKNPHDEDFPDYDSPRITALLTRTSISELAKGNPSLPGFPSYASLGDAILAAGSDTDNPASQRTAECVMFILDSRLHSVPASMRQQITALVNDYLSRGFVGIVPSAADTDDPWITDLIRHGSFTSDELDSMAHTVINAIASTYPVVNPSLGVFRRFQSTDYHTATWAGGFLNFIYSVETTHPSGQPATAEHIQSERQWATDTLAVNLANRQSNTFSPSIFISEFTAALNKPSG